MAILTINHRTITLHPKVLQLRTVTSVVKYHRIRPFPFKWRYIAIGIFLVIAGLSSLGKQNNGSMIVLCLVAGSFVFYAIKRNLEPRDYWVLLLETAAGSSSLVASTDERAIDDGVQGITAAMEADVSYQHVVNINDSTIISDSEITNSTIQNMARPA